MTGMESTLGLDGVYPEEELPLLIQRRGMARWDDGVVRLLDRRELPWTESYIECREVEDVARAIETMAIQGAFTLSIAAGYGMALAVADVQRSAVETLPAAAERAFGRLRATRPTGLALHRMLVGCRAAALGAFDAGRDPVAAVVDHVDSVAARLARQALRTARTALELLDGRRRVLTHCFADRSLLYLMLEARRTGQPLELFASETRPFLQGSRLTAYSAQQTGTPVTLLTDGMGGALMRDGRVDALVTAADLVCMDGTICNKIGTYQFALAAKANHIPYVVLRQSGPDTEAADESVIEIEYRDPESVLHVRGMRTAPDGVDAVYPAFDITPPSLVTAIATDRGAFSPGRIGEYVTAADAS